MRQEKKLFEFHDEFFSTIKKIDKRVFLNGPPYIDLLEFGLAIQRNEVLDNVFCQHVGQLRDQIYLSLLHGKISLSYVIFKVRM